jgi:hypothetical protein
LRSVSVEITQPTGCSSMASSREGFIV